MHIGLIKWLLNSRIGHPGHVPDLVEQRVRINLIARQIIAEDLNVNRGRQTEVQNLANHVGRQERKGHPWKLLGQADAEVVNILSRLVVVDRESYKNVRVRGAYGSRVVVRRIDTAVREPNIVNHIGDLAWRELLFDRSLHEIAETGGLLDACPGGGSEVEIERAAVDRGEEVLSQPGNNQGQGAEARGEK